MATSSRWEDRGVAYSEVQARAARRAQSRRRAARILVVLLLAPVALAAAGTGYRFRPATAALDRLPPTIEIPSDAKSIRQLENRLRRRDRELRAALDRRRPKGTYIVIDQTQNRLYLMKDEEVLREAVCSAGSGMILEETAGDRRWVFDTPRGIFKVMSRIEDPVWKKPDWAFIEEGKPIPKNDSERFDYGVLGEYALYFGNGYMIHGTLYERLLGRSVTHGCIRLGRDDLREVFRAAPIGTPIYIY